MKLRNKAFLIINATSKKIKYILKNKINYNF